MTLISIPSGTSLIATTVSLAPLDSATGQFLWSRLLFLFFFVLIIFLNYLLVGRAMKYSDLTRGLFHIFTPRRLRLVTLLPPSFSPLLTSPLLSFPLLYSPLLSFPLLPSFIHSFPLLSSPLLSSTLFSSPLVLLVYSLLLVSRIMLASRFELFYAVVSMCNVVLGLVLS